MLKLIEIIFPLIFTLLLNNVIICQSASCSTYSSESTCLTNSACSWIYRSGAYSCACASEAPQDIYFLMDSSGSVQASGWAQETAFVVDMIESGVGNTSRIGIANFASGSWIKYNLTQTQHPRSIITAVVNGIAYTQGSTYTRTGVASMISAYKKFATKGYNRLLLLITDGIPQPASTQSPCPLKSSLDAQNITVVIIGVTSGFSASAVDCLVDDSSTQIILVSSFTSFDLIRDYTDNFLCPSLVSLTLTEIRIQTSSKSSCQFIELYNSGSLINLKTNPLKFSGLVTGTLNSSIKANITAGQYVVLYKSGTSPLCFNCSCLDANANKRCDKALYIPCDGKNCTFNTLYNGKTANNTNWGVIVRDGSDNSVVVNISYKKSTWPSITSGYTYELQDLAIDDSVGSNWAQSCWEYGTPGQAPLPTCTNCKASVCQANGDTGAHCTGLSCNCTETKKYYSLSSSCYIVPNVTNCKTLITKDSGLNYIYISWTDAATTATHYYYVKYPYDSAVSYATTAIGTNFYGYYDDTVNINSFVPLVETIIPDNSSTLTLSGVRVVYGDWVPCPITTQSPTKAPTPGPTYGVPLVPSCNVTISGTNTVIIKWKTPNYTPPTTPTFINYYKIYATCSGTEYVYYSTSRVYTNVLGSCPTLTTSSLTLKVVAVVNTTAGTENDSLMRLYATTCTVSTASPTKSPTKSPSKPPTLKPSIGPTRTPSRAPTYEYWRVTSCVVTILQGGQAINFSYTEYIPSDTSNPRTIAYYDKQTDSTAQINGNPGTAIISGVSVSDTNRFTVFPQFLQYPNGPLIGQTCCNSTCTIVSLAPTPSPTQIPSTFPTTAPTGIPTGLPTNAPTVVPTPGPTYYGQLQVSDCNYTLYAHNTMVRISFFEATGFSVDGVDTPTLTSSIYKVTFDGEPSFISLSPITPGAYYTTNQSIPGFVNETGPFYVTVYFEDVKPVGPTIRCRQFTVAPTPSPTFTPTTPVPSYGSPSIYFDPSAFSSECSYSSGPTAVCTISPSALAQTLLVKRDPSLFGYDISFDWAIDLTGRRRLSANSNDFQGAISGQPLITSTAGSKTISYTYTKEHNDSVTVTFTVYISNCWVSDSNYDPSVHQYTCTVGEPSEVLVTVSSSQAAKYNNTLSDLPTWIWGAIAGGVLALLLLTFFGYRYYKKKQFADQMTETKKQELKEAEDLDGAGNFGGIGDDVRFNPLATGGTHDIASGGQYIDQQLAKQKNNNEIAQVDVDTTVYRQDYGQVQVNKRK